MSVRIYTQIFYKDIKKILFILNRMILYRSETLTKSRVNITNSFKK